MDREHIRAVAEKAKGAVKETAGKVIGDEKLKAKGKADKAKGASRKVAGDVKERVREYEDK
jgi:uncharacterized protein YjbJ (UPF0337 family)